MATQDLHELPDRFPGMTEEEAARLTAEVREIGKATFTHDGWTWDLRPSEIPGSPAIWAKARARHLIEFDPDAPNPAAPWKVTTGERGSVEFHARNELLACEMLATHIRHEAHEKQQANIRDARRTMRQMGVTGV